MREDRTAEAYALIKEANPFPSICGRICSAPCEAACILTEENAPIGIRALERYAADHGKARHGRKEQMVRKGKKIAIIGAGPSGLTAAVELAKKGFQVTLFEALDQPGGVLRYGIPEFRVPKDVLDYEIAEVQALGVHIQTNFYLGKTATLDDLKQQGFVAILLTMGAGVPKFIDLPGVHYGGVYYGEEFLMRAQHLQRKGNSKENAEFFVGENVTVIGSGNTALDCARVARRMGRSVKLVFRRTEDDMRVREQEQTYAKEEGVIFEPLVKPLAVLPNHQEYVDALKCIRMDFADEDNTGAWKLIPVEGSEFTMRTDTVIFAIGHRPNTYLIQAHPELTLTENGTIEIDSKTFATSIPGVFACGNVVTNAGPVVKAIQAGKLVAQQIESYVR